MQRYIVTQGQPPQVPPQAVWWSIHEHDGEMWHRLTYGENEKGKAIMAWPVAEATMATIVGRWGPGTYRISWHSRDKRSKIGTSDPLTIQTPLDPLQHTMDEAGEEYSFSQGPVGVSGAIQTPLDHFMVMYPLLRTQVDAESQRIQKIYELAIEQERARTLLMMQQTKEYWQSMTQLRTAQDPRVEALEQQVRDLLDGAEDDGEMRLDTPTTALIVQELVKGLLPVVGHLVSKYTDKPAPTLPEADDGPA